MQRFGCAWGPIPMTKKRGTREDKEVVERVRV